MRIRDTERSVRTARAISRLGMGREHSGSGHRTRRLWRRAVRALAAAACWTGVAWAQPAADVAVERPRRVLPDQIAPEVRVRAPRLVSPLPGVSFDRDRMSANVQSATARQLRDAQSINVTDYIANTMQSVSVNDYAGNPFQQDLVFRGFSASPLIGTPQGLSVYVDGVRVNEPFGEVVNWDLIPLGAIQRMDLVPGADPLFGLNTLGGALAITTKSGFTTKRTEVSALAGSWGRRQIQFSAGGNNGVIAGFLSANKFREDGWRRNSGSDVQQLFGRVDLRYARGSATLTWLAADNTLTGNGMVPYELWKQDPASIFTSPDRANNAVQHFNAIARVDLSERSALSVQTYRRDMRQDSVGGDFWDEFRAASSRLRLDCPDGPPNVADGATGVDLPGCPNVQPNGLLNTGRTGQVGDGVQLLWTYASPRHQFVAGAAFDRNAVSFRQGQRLGFLSDSREFTYTPERLADVGLVPLAQEIQRNDLSGGMESQSAYAKDIWSIRDNLHLNFGLRWNRTRVKNALVADRPIPLYQFDENFFNRLQPRCGAEIGGLANRFARYFCSTGDYVYQSLNPSLGLTWLPNETLNLYANWSRGTRVPSTIELGCARDREAEAQVRGRTPGCSVPTALTSDPYLPQVVSYTTEIGVRGALASGLRWNATAYRTDLTNDILFVSLGSRNRGVFDTFGSTRRQGFELGFEGDVGRHTLRASLSHVEATFESTATIVNPSNSTATTAIGQVSEFQIRPGDRIPGIPQNALRLAWRWRATDALSIGLSTVAHSWSYVRGNENNDHQPGGTDSNGAPTLGTLDPSITVEPGRARIGSGRIPGYAIVNLLASWRITDALTATLRVDNVFDTRYVTAGELALNPFAPSRWGVRDAAGFNFNSNDWTHSTFVGPGAPRAGWLGFTYVFDHPGSGS